MDFTSFSMLMAQEFSEPMQQQSKLSWAISSLGGYGLLLPLIAFLVFLGACFVVFINGRPKVIAAYVILLPLPLLMGIFGSFQGFINSYTVIATAQTAPKPSEIAAGISAGLFSTQVGLLLSFPSYFLVAFGLLFRTITSREVDIAGKQ